VGIHRHQQRAEALHPELPQRLRIEVVEVHLLDRLHPGGLERGGAADDREIGAPELLECAERAVPEPALSDQDARAVFPHQRARESLHAGAGGGAHAHRRVSSRSSLGFAHPSHVGRGVDQRVAAQVETGLPPAIEHVDERRIADAEERAVERHRVVHAERPHLLLGHRRCEIVVRHHASRNRRSCPSA
jgi:hypothetical protein